MTDGPMTEYGPAQYGGVAEREASEFDMAIGLLREKIEVQAVNIESLERHLVVVSHEDDRVQADELHPVPHDPRSPAVRALHDLARMVEQNTHRLVAARDRLDI